MPGSGYTRDRENRRRAATKQAKWGVVEGRGRSETEKLKIWVREAGELRVGAREARK
jgi:hypothetical protein